MLNCSHSPSLIFTPARADRGAGSHYPCAPPEMKWLRISVPPQLTNELIAAGREISLSGGQSRCVEGHEDLWLNRLAPLALRAVQPIHSPLPLAHPSQLSVPLLMPPRFCAGFRHCVGSHTRRRSPPVGSSTDRGRGSNPRGGTAVWSHPRRREVPHGLTEGGLLPRAPAGGIATPRAPRALHLTSTAT